MSNSQSLGVLSKFSDLKNRLVFLVLALIVYRIGIHITIPGIDASYLMQLMEASKGEENRGISAMINLFSGGAFERMSIFMLGVMPYITASIVMQMLTVVYPPLEQLKKEGQAGRRKITQYTRYLTILFAGAQGFFYSLAIVKGAFTGDQNVVLISSGLFLTISTITLLTGTMFLMWLGEQITEKGIGNGISMLIFASILMGVPSGASHLFEIARTNGNYFIPIVLFAIILVTIFCIVFVERGQRRITINYARKQQGRRMSVGTQSSHLPLKLNMAGVIPAIFGSAFLAFVNTISAGMQSIEIATVDLQTLSSWAKIKYYVASFFQGVGEAGVRYFAPGKPAYIIIFAALIIFFCFFYTAIQFNSKETAENLKRSGGFIPGIRPGINTSQYLDKVLTRITLWGALYITIICLLPEILNGVFNLNFYLGGTSILIAVVVVMDLVTQIQAHLMSHQYESLMKRANISSALGNNGRPPSI